MTGRLGRSVVPVLLALTALGSACRIPVQEQAQQVPIEGREEVLFGPSTTTTTLQLAPEEGAGFPLGLYFVDGNGELELVTRMLSTTPSLDEVLVALTEAPQEAEIEQFGEQLNTRLPPNLEPQAATERINGTLIIDVNPEAALRSTLDQETEQGRLIFSQIVCTVTKFDTSVVGVQIFDDGEEPITVTDADGQPIAGPAGRANFNQCETGEDREEAEAEAEAEAEGLDEAEGADGEPTDEG